MKIAKIPAQLPYLINNFLYLAREVTNLITKPYLLMNISMEELRQIKHQLPTGSIAKIAEQLGLDNQTVRNYFGAKKFKNGVPVDSHIQPGPHGGYVNLENTEILDLAKELIKQSNSEISADRQPA